MNGTKVFAYIAGATAQRLDPLVPIKVKPDMTEKEKWELKSHKLNYRLSIYKNLLILIGTILLFIIIQRPESILNRKSSEETISRERAKLILDYVIKEEKIENRIQAFKVIKETFPESEDEYFKSIEQLIELERPDFLNRLLSQYLNLKVQKSQLEERFEEEITGTNNNSPGRGPVAYEIKNRIKLVDEQIKTLEEIFSDYNFDIYKTENNWHQQKNIMHLADSAKNKDDRN